MRKIFPAEELARDSRFIRQTNEQRLSDPRGPRVAGGNASENLAKLTPGLPNGPDRARALMHGIFVGEIQALEGAGRTCWDFEVGDEVPLALKMDMARQCWDEARHCEISVALAEHMGTELGEYAENGLLYEAACNPDPVLRLTGVNRPLEGMPKDVFNTKKELGNMAGDPVLEFC